MDDFRKLRLDAKEFLSEVRVLDCRHGGWHRISVEHAVARLNDSALGDIDQLAAHEVQESARNVSGALRKHVRRQGCPVKGKEMKSSAERLSYHDGVKLA